MCHPSRHRQTHRACKLLYFSELFLRICSVFPYRTPHQQCCPQPSATVRNRPQPFATVRGRPCKAHMDVPVVSSAKGSLLEVAHVPLLRFAWQAWHIQTCFVTCRKSFCVAGAILLRRFQNMRCSFPGRRSTLETSIIILRGRRSTSDVLYTPHCALYTPHSTLYPLHFTLHTLHSTLYTQHFALYTLHSTLYTPHSTLHTPHSTL